jgi:hypothetical protein
LTVVGTGPSGVADSFGNLLDGRNARGDAGSNFVTIVSAADLVLATANHALLRAYEKIVFEQSEQLGALS